MATRNLFEDRTMGVEESLYNMISWTRDPSLTLDKEIALHAFTNPDTLFDFGSDRGDISAKQGSNYFHSLSPNRKELTSLYLLEYGESISASKPHWNGTINVTHNNFLGIDNLDLVIDNHRHNVLESLFFENIELKLSGTRNDGSVYNLFIPLNATSSTKYRSSVGVEGIIGANKDQKDYQMGLKQIFYYYAKFGTRYIGIKLELSIVLTYHNNDFEPLGVIDTVKFFPQIKITSDFKEEGDEELLPGFKKSLFYPDGDEYFNLLTSSDLPTDIDLSSLTVQGYNARVKMTAYNNSSHHLDIKEDDNGNYIDYNHFRAMRDNGYAIPHMFEKYFDPSILSSNVPSLYTDSNESEKDYTNKLRKFAVYQKGKILPPTWAYIFDYTKPNINEECEIHAVYNSEDLYEKPDAFNDERKQSYLYPPGNPDNKQITLTKLPRQGQYDNIHFHGYMGHYADNNEPVLHAPICGYCCFHLHWRWAQLNYDLSTSLPSKILQGGGNPNRFNGWDTNGFRKGNGYGLPLIPPNQSLKIAVTNKDKQPYSRDSVLNPESPAQELNKNVKTVWYSIDMTEHALRNGFSHVILEQGAGYAFQYNNRVESIYQWIKTTIKIIKYRNRLLPTPIIPALIIEFLDELLDVADIPGLFEVIYRFMRFYNFDSLYPDWNQIPNGSYHPSVTAPSMEKL